MRTRSEENVKVAVYTEFDAFLQYLDVDSGTTTVYNTVLHILLMS